MKTLTTLLILTLSVAATAQEIAGVVVDEKKEPPIYAALQIKQGNATVASGITDIQGKYRIKPLEPGYYNVLVTYPGYDSIMVTGVIVAAGQRTTVNFNTRPHDSSASSSIKIIAYKKPVVERDLPNVYCPVKEFPTTSAKSDTLKMVPVPYPPGNEKQKNR